MRTFFAIPVTSQVSTELLREFDKLSDKPVSRVEANDLHLTLAFLPDLAATNVALLEDVLAASVRISPFVLQLSTLGRFPAQPNIIAAMPIETSPGYGRLYELRESVTAALESLTVAFDARKFLPHVTLGRLQKNSAAIVDPPPINISLPVNAVVLYRSVTGRQGGHYKALAKIPLR